MTRKFRDLLSAEARKKLEQKDRHYQQCVRETRGMSDESLCASIYFALGQMDGPFRALPGDMTYSSVFFHVYVPELLRRLGMKDRRENVHPIIGSDAFFDLPPDE